MSSESNGPMCQRYLMAPQLEEMFDLFVRSYTSAVSASPDIHLAFAVFSRKKFKCNICDEKFETETELRQHSKLEHGGKR